MSDLQNLPHLLNIAARAIAADACQAALREAKSNLSTAYATWKAEHGLERVERDGEKWESMLLATKGEYEALQLARRAAHNEKRRLGSAVRRYRHEVQAAG